MKTFYMHHYLCIVQCVDEKKKTRCTLLNIMQNKETTKIIKKKYKYDFFFLFSLSRLVSEPAEYRICVCKTLN